MYTSLHGASHSNRTAFPRKTRRLALTSPGFTIGLHARYVLPCNEVSAAKASDVLLKKALNDGGWSFLRSSMTSPNGFSSARISASATSESPEIDIEVDSKPVDTLVTRKPEPKLARIC